MMYLSEETFRKHNVRDKTQVKWYSSAAVMFPNCLKYSDKLDEVRREKGIEAKFERELVRIEGN